MKKLLALVLSLVLVLSAVPAAGAAENKLAEPSVVSATVDYQTNPVGIAADDVKFSWAMESDAIGASQPNYQIVVRKDSADGEIVWDSGVVDDTTSVAVAYGGKTLEQGARYFWTVTITDQDLFPAGNVTLNGMKIYSDRSASQIIGFASAVVQTAGSGLAPLFDEMMHSQNGRHYRVDTFRRYEGGGLGAEIQGDVILMGSIGFMKLMKVQMPEGTRLKQAVYLSVNGELAAVFALNYAPAAGIRSGLSAAAHTAGLLPLLATRDFMITPQFLKLRYKIAPDRVEFPTVEERAQLSEPNAGLGGMQGALLARDSFEGFLAAVSGARAMRGAAIGSIAIAVMGGVMGLLVLTFLTFLGATLSASCWNLFLYTLLWLVPGILITSLSSRR